MKPKRVLDYDPSNPNANNPNGQSSIPESLCKDATSYKFA